MAKQNRTTLKGYFETGDTPSQAQYADLIDSNVNLSENNIGDVQITGNITASGDISASGTIFADNFQSTGGDVNGISFTDDLNLAGDLTASGNISSSGTVEASAFTLNGVPVGSSTDTFWNSGSSGKIFYNGGNVGIGNTSPVEKLTVTGNISASGNLIVSQITASGNISASGIITAEGLVISDDLSITDTLTVGTISNVNTTHITASGNISSSATGSFGMLIVDQNITSSFISASSIIYANQFYVNHKVALSDNGSTTGRVFGDTSITDIQIGRNGSANRNIELLGPVTASTTISASSNIEASAYKIQNHSLASITGTTTAFGFENNTPIQIGKNSNPTKIIGHITASGNISSSGTLITNEINVLGHITASGNISASGVVTAEGLVISDDASITDTLTVGTIANVLTTHITASGNISASGTTGTNQFGAPIILDNNKFLQSKRPDGTISDMIGFSSGDFIDIGTTSINTTIDAASLFLQGVTQISLQSNGGLVTLKSSANATAVVVNTIGGHISASGNISASGKFIGAEISASTAVGGLTLTGNVTSSDNISSSGTITANAFIGDITGDLTGQAATVATIAGLAPNTATTQATQAAITTAANLTTVGALNAGSITSGFTSIDVGAGAITTTGTVSAGIVNASSHISASGGISSSGTGSFGMLIVDQNITASGNISASGNITAGNVFLPSNGVISFDNSLDGSDQKITGVDNQIVIDGDDLIVFKADTNYEFRNTSNQPTFHIDVEGAISASGDVFGEKFVELTQTVAAAGSNIGDATAIAATAGRVFVTTDDAAKGVKLPAVSAVTKGTTFTIHNTAASTALEIYPTANDKILPLADDAPATLAASTAMVITAFSADGYVGYFTTVIS